MKRQTVSPPINSTAVLLKKRSPNDSLRVRVIEVGNIMIPLSFLGLSLLRILYLHNGALAPFAVGELTNV